MPLLFALTMFVSASLLFMIQPMIGKMTAPLLGGTPAVWNTCMVFFQALLLGGYYYAHKVTDSFSSHRQTVIHTAVLLVPAFVMVVATVFSESHLPIPILPSLSPQGSDYPFFGVIVMLAVAIGLPFFVISTSAPLLQVWFNYTGHPSSRDPYFLYGASNFGSLLSLVAYPTYIESALTVAEQTYLFGLGYLLLAVMAVVCSRAVRAAKSVAPPPKEDPSKPVKDDGVVAPTRLDKLRWLGLAFVPSSLMLGVTTFISTDIASLPLLWIIPLGLYLLTFIIAFANTRWPAVVLMLIMATMSVIIGDIYLPTQQEILENNASPLIANLGLGVGVGLLAFAIVVSCLRNGAELFHQALTLVTPIFVLLVVFLHIAAGTFSVTHQVLIGLSILAFFSVTLLCHSELNRTRPASRYLTNFYLTMSFGGMLGGMLNSLVAPIVFTFISEYPLTLVIACMVFPTLTPPLKSNDIRVTRLWDFITALLLFSLCLAMMMGKARIVGLFESLGTMKLSGDNPTLPVFSRYSPTISTIVVFGFPAMIAYLFVERPFRFGLCVAAIFFASFMHSYRASNESAEYYGRSYFGTLKIERSSSDRRIEPANYYKNQFHLSSDAFNAKTGEKLFEEDGSRTQILERRKTYLRLVHGTTLHGQQLEHADFWGVVGALAPLGFNDPFSAAAAMVGGGYDAWQYPGREPLTYYHRTGPVGSMFQGFSARNARATAQGQKPNTDVACIGLGTGSLSSYGLPGQKMTFFEIDTHVRKLVEPDPEYVKAHKRLKAKPGEIEQPYFFTYIDSARKQGVDIEFAMGDARIKLDEMKERKFGFMLIDAFSSDAIPVHLLTKEAVKLYFDRLEEDGLLALHISNRHLDLEPVAKRIADTLEVSALAMRDDADNELDRSGSNWLVLARKPEYLADVKADKRLSLVAGKDGLLEGVYRPKWVDLEDKDGVLLWTDDFSPIKHVLRWKFDLFKRNR